MLVFGLTEPTATALLLTVLGGLLAISVLFSRAFDRLGVPVVLLFLLLGVLAGSDGFGAIAFDDYDLAFRLGTLALILILFDGGLNTSVSSVKRGLAPASVLATLGVALTAALIAVFARLLGLPWAGAILLGAVVSSTDAATVFAVLRGGRLRLRERVGRTLELESGLNDPMAVILTTAVTASMTGGGGLGWSLLWLIPLQLIIGGLVGILIGFAGRALLRHVRLAAGGLYAVLTLAIALLAFGSATVVMGSGFLAVYVTAVVLGGSELPYQGGLRRIHDAISWLSQIGMFMMLGLLVFPTQLPPVALQGLALALFLAFIARPLAVWLCLLPFRFKPAEVLFLSWVGLRGAVPIILATIPVMAGVPDGMRIFNLVFFVVVINALVPGATVRWVTRRLKLEAPEAPTAAAALEINSMRDLQGVIRSFYITPVLAVCDASLSQIKFPEGAAAVLVVRGEQLLACKGGTVLRNGDHVYVFFRREDRPFIELLFGGPQGA